MKKYSSIAMVAMLVVLTYTATMAQSSADKPPPSSRGGATTSSKPELKLTKRDILNSSKITFLGIDLTETLFVGGYEEWKSEDELKRLNPQWNQLMVSEADKYNLRRALRNNNIDYQVGICIDHNDNVNFKEKITFTDPGKPLTSEQIQNIMSSYDFKDLTGLGMMFVIESFNKNKAEGTMALTFVNLNNKEIIYEERLSGPSAGFGLRNHWARSILEAIIQIDKKRYKTWEKTF
ncbi:MAG TPA: hypothetical protein VGA21_05050 [Cyclobacteriaceae bacterium]|jgi:hypothetical protein